jgi:hypothetical protein
MKSRALQLFTILSFLKSVTVMSKHKNKNQPIPETAQGDRVWNANLVLWRECAAQSIIPGAVAPLMRNKELIEKLEKPQEFVDLAKMLDKDVKSFADRLESIHSRHADRDGSATDPDDKMEALSIGEEYLAWSDDYSNVVTPTVTQMCDIGEKALGLPYEQTLRGKLESAHRLKREAAEAANAPTTPADEPAEQTGAAE